MTNNELSATFGGRDFTLDELRVLEPYFTNLSGPVFALVNLPEVVKGAMFARYSRSSKSLRRLFLDEFFESTTGTVSDSTVSVTRAERLFERVLTEYGDDSVAQLCGVHLACEGVSNIFTKVLEWGRLLAYLEQSTRYVPYTDRPGGQWKYHIPAEFARSPLCDTYSACLDRAFDTYTKWLDPMQAYLRKRYPKADKESDGAYSRTIRAKALDVLRGLLPAATQSNVGIFGSAQGYEALLLRMRAHPLAEVRRYADLMLMELRKVIPSLMKRIDHPERGVLWSKYLEETRIGIKSVAQGLLAGVTAEPRDEVVLTDYDHDGEIKVVAAALYSVSDLPDDELLRIAQRMNPSERAAVILAYVGDRKNRRHKPGRAFERTAYRFDILTDYGAFRDLQRHRLLTLEWQPLSPNYGYVTPIEIEEAGALADWQQVMDESAALYERLCAESLSSIAPYAISMAYRVRFYMEMNAREAMHIIELRTTPQGHPSYRRICQMMHRLIAEKAGHRAIAEAMVYVNHSSIDLGRLQAERASELRQQQIS